MKATTPLITLKKVQRDFPKVKIGGSADVEAFVRQFYGDDLEIFESMFLLMLNRANNTVGYAKISQGGVAGTVVDIKIIAKYALDSLASSVILCHNHPSGNTQPSQQDIAITKKCKDALGLFEISLLDHLILTAESSYSMADNGQC